MSANIVPLKSCEVIDPLVDLSNLDKREYGIFNGGQNVSWQPYLAQSVNNNSIQLTTMPPDEKTIIDPKVYVQVTYQLTFAGTNTIGGNLLQIGTGAKTDGPRAYPFSQTCSTVSATLNNQSITTLLSQWFNAFIHYGDYKKCYASEFSATPSMLDQCQQYASLNGTNRNPFGAFGDNVLDENRGAFSGIQIVSNTSTTAVVNLTVYEPIFLPGFMFNHRGITNVRTLQWLFTFSNLNRVWSHDNVSGNTITSITTNITQFQMWFKFITPKILEAIPKQVVYSYHEIVPSITQGISTTAGSAGSISMNALNLQAIPKLIYVYIRKQDADLTAFDADSFFRIDNISMNFMNVTGLLASASPQALWAESKRNGLDIGWSEWSQVGSGSVMCIKLGSTIGLSSLFAPGLLSYPQVSMVVKYTNISSSTIVPQMFVQVVYEGAMTIANGTMSKSTAVLSSSDVLQSQLKDAPVVEAKPAHDFYGGGLVEDATKFVKSVVEAVDSGVKVGAQVLPLIGLGAGRKKKGRGLTGGDMIGGRMISRDELSATESEYAEY